MSTLDRSIFKAYDIRGIVDRNLGPDVVRSIGLAVGARVRAAGGTEVVVGRDGELRFDYQVPNAPGFAGFPDALRPVRWGARRYMIPDGKRIAFVNAINHGREPRNVVHGMFLLAQGDEKKAAA